MRILFLTGKPIYPPIGGAALRNWQNIQALQPLAEIATFSIISGSAPIKVGPSMPPDVTLAVNIYSSEIRSRLHALRKLERKLWWVRPYGHWWADQFYSGWVEHKLQAVIDEFKPSIIILEELWLHRYLKVLQKSDATLIYDAHNVEFTLRKQIQKSLSRFSTRLKSSVANFKVRAIEKTVIRKVNQVWVCSAEDANLIEKIYSPNLNTKIVPNGIDVDFYNNRNTQSDSSLTELKTDMPKLLFVGTFSYSPNAKAAEILIQHIFPGIQAQYPDCQLLLVGDGPTPFMLSANRKNKNIIVTGRVKDVRSYLAGATLSVMPLQEGGGTRLKILEAFAARCPVITTPKGAEGIDALPNYHLLIGNTSSDLVDMALSLVRDQSHRRYLADNAYELVLERYSWSALKAKIQASALSLISQ
jgi:glycosyltransferase involved in cell wall biosynthesis